jgi:hypothetical protein
LQLRSRTASPSWPSPDGKRLRLKSQCTTGPERRIPRWEHEHLLEAVRQPLDANSPATRQRRETVEHSPLGSDHSRHCGPFPGSPSRMIGQATWRSIVPIDVP